MPKHFKVAWSWFWTAFICISLSWTKNYFIRSNWVTLNYSVWPLDYSAYCEQSIRMKYLYRFWNGMDDIQRCCNYFYSWESHFYAYAGRRGWKILLFPKFSTLYVPCSLDFYILTDNRYELALYWHQASAGTIIWRHIFGFFWLAFPRVIVHSSVPFNGGYP